MNFGWLVSKEEEKKNYGELFLCKVALGYFVGKKNVLSHTAKVSQRRQEPGDIFLPWAMECGICGEMLTDKHIFLLFSLLIKNHEHYKNNSIDILNISCNFKHEVIKTAFVHNWWCNVL